MTEQEIILKMAKAMTRSYWKGDRPHEKRLITMATNAWHAIKGIEEVQEMLRL